MQSFIWGEQFVTGFDVVDEQHKNLVKLVNKLGSQVSKNAFSKKELLRTLQELTDYTQVHFSSEEKLMREYGVDQRHIKKHIQEHVYFVEEVSRFIDRIDLEQAEETNMLLEYLIHWLAFHILGTDQNMARQMEQLKNGKESYIVYEEEERDTDSSTAPLVKALIRLFHLVSASNRKLSDMNMELEERVAERTAKLVQANRELEKVSVTDHLTQLPNRRFAMSQLQLLFDESRERKYHLSCMMIDADNFKEINDNYGHDAGDIVLQNLAKELKYGVRTDDIVCRLGGDEFIIICPNTNEDGAVYLAEQVKKKVNALTVKAGNGVWIGSVSIGVGCFTEQMQSVEDLIKAADIAVYKAKAAGRNCVQF